MKKIPFSHGFTLMELMLVTAILLVIGLAVLGTFTNGISIWNTVTQESTAEDINLLFEKITFDLRNSFNLAGIKFRGGRSEVSFPARIKVSDKNGVRNSIGQVSYAFDGRTKTLSKNQLNYSEVYRKKDGLKHDVAENINSFRFKYFIYDQKTKKYSWENSWQENDEPFGIEVEENLPLIIRMEATVPVEGGVQTHVRTVAIPSACCWPFIDDDK